MTAALVDEVRRLRAVAAWVHRLAAHERLMLESDDDEVWQAIHQDRRVLLQEMQRLLSIDVSHDAERQC